MARGNAGLFNSQRETPRVGWAPPTAVHPMDHDARFSPELAVPTPAFCSLCAVPRPWWAVPPLRAMALPACGVRVEHGSTAKRLKEWACHKRWAHRRWISQLTIDPGSEMATMLFEESHPRPLGRRERPP